MKAQAREEAREVVLSSLGRTEDSAVRSVAAAAGDHNCSLTSYPIWRQGGCENPMRLGYLIAFDHVQGDLESGEVEGDTEADCLAKVGLAATALTYQHLRDLPKITSVETWEISERRFHLDLGSDAEDLDLEEVTA